MITNRKVYNIFRYSEYNNDGKELFKGLREAIIKIYPKDDKGKYTEAIEKIAEEVSFDQTDIIMKKINDIVETKMKTVIEQVEQKIAAAVAAAGATTGTV